MGNWAGLVTTVSILTDELTAVTTNKFFKDDVPAPKYTADLQCVSAVTSVATRYFSHHLGLGKSERLEDFEAVSVRQSDVAPRLSVQAMDTATMLRYDERIKTENSAAELWNDRHFRDKEDEALHRLTNMQLRRPATSADLTRSSLHSHSRLHSSHSRDRLSSSQSQSLPPIILPTSLAAARVQGGWLLPHHSPPPIPVQVATRRPISNAEYELVRRSRRLVRQQRNCFSHNSNAAGPRRVCRLGPAMTGLELAKDQHHPRSSLPHYYGYSLHTSKSVTGIDLRGAASV